MLEKKRRKKECVRLKHKPAPERSAWAGREGNMQQEEEEEVVVVEEEEV